MEFATHRVTLAHKLFSVYAAMSLLIFGLVWIFEAQGSRAARGQDLYTRKLYMATQIELATTEMQGAQRGLMLSCAMKDESGKKQYVALYDDSSNRIDSLLAELRPLIVTEQEKIAAAGLEANRSDWRPRFQQLRHLCAAGDVEGAYKLRNANKVISAAMHVQARVLVAEQKMASEAARERSGRSSLWITVIAVLLGSVLGSAGWWVVRKTVRGLRHSIIDVRDGSGRVAHAAARISHSSRQVAQAACEQARSLEEAAALEREMASNTKENAEHSQQAAVFVNDLTAHVAGAGATLQSMVQSMDEITHSSGKISKIIRVIDAIAFQTNILALNASVEAARAGTAGAGFAVVADEVRNLAQRSAQAARDTADLIEESIRKSGEGGEKLGEVAASIRAIAESAQSVKELVDAVDQASTRQAVGMDSIAQSVTRMDEVTRRTAANAQSGAGESDELAEQSTALNGVVARLQLLVGSDVR
jgi:methyl-accepting chemotaxis protein/methyl-accepting chemotaxis protein-1 (serine sensor receptor)